tara:strand:+ start:196 stop:396 length:201 start_codon:yes stop_codon:yes gene_type:complete
MSGRVGVLVVALATAVVMTIGLLVFGSIGWNGSIFLGVIAFLLLAAFLNWAIFRPLPEIKNGRRVE